MIPVYFVFAGAFFSLLGSLSYIVETLQGKTKPNRVTWFLWTLLPLIAVIAQIRGGIGLPSVTVSVASFSAFIVFICSFINKKAYWKTTLPDYVCGALSLTGLVLWYVMRNQDYAIIFSILADFLASVPTLRKAWHHPETENGLSYFLWILNNGIGVLCLPKPSFTGFAFAGYLFLLNLSLF